MTVNSVGINELNAQNLITISPNPTSSIFKIECPMNGANVILYNLIQKKPTLSNRLLVLIFYNFYSVFCFIIFYFGNINAF
jgi:hypothetical protein